MTAHPGMHPRIRSYVLRAGRVGSGQARALADIGPLYRLPYQPGVLDFEAVFNRRAPRILEIGFGMGEGLAETAAAHPDHDYLGVEVHTPGVGALLKQIGERGLVNVRVIQHDAVDVLTHMLAPASLAGLHIFFPDPWHKKRHHKRRLIQPPLVQLLASRLQPGGYIHLATDWQDYAGQMLAVLSAEPLLRNTVADYAPRPDTRPLTKFEQRGIRLGHGVWDLVFRRI
ncbi:MAG: tRNA (guanosine(46)-N7)-methyltransferase TrmB [Thiobacillus sp. 63-78]|uniref:tRNA (guanosine(46)-N7)-methyltransferase TrmB n=1 Tax=Thiobacillus sp. 63-78 TaxID=1895859 RepID=UPI0009657B1D|nr:tRNA (guanosine(46)-N7)-methyltransferase TrmB [Thiobacillus sp. 63-78]MBN8763490.1 tRNA (guanosine(46)-N7)-methyltransferase TrmB [Thiobacillus sp.]MBN8774529.1 tRNA (guanosine(46)-N7)-methyltransferase TrmB [Thiobacillus sp.]OJZ12451.1 MAG: tRNA (guanosine(46)-N7)-methyltransferase TrmB [Thiobacillus sp. 63-78]